MVAIEQNRPDVAAQRPWHPRFGGSTLAPRLRWLMVATAFALVVIPAIQSLQLTPQYPMTRTLMLTQDLPTLALMAAVLLAIAAGFVPAAWGDLAKSAAAQAPRTLALLIIGAGLLTALGTRYIAAYTPVSHDEVMSQFDTEIIKNGQLMAPIPPEWRSLSWALEPVFRVPVPGDVAWVSTYLPGNAILRAGLGKLFDPAIVNGLLVAAALLALLGIARQLWPGRRDLWVITLALAATSSQTIGMGSTPFAMTAHLTFNLIWLWLVLRNTALSHAAALLLGFWATGLHQMIFHPLFAAPFILQMLLDRRWPLAAIYVASYAAIGIFWIIYWQLLLAGHGIAPDASKSMGLTFFLARVAHMLRDFSSSGPETLLQNVMRFMAWQNPLLVLLLVPGLVLGWRAGGVLRSLAGGILLTLLAMFILLPYQDIGWGYRYVHGLIGSAALLGAFAAGIWLGAMGPDQRRAWWGAMAAGTAAALVLLMPLHGWHMYSWISPYTRSNAAIAAAKTEAVIIETISIRYGIELVRNDPYLRNRPLTFDIGLLDEKLIRELCSRMTVSVFDGDQAARLGVEPLNPKEHFSYDRLNAIRTFAESAECRQMKR